MSIKSNTLINSNKKYTLMDFTRISYKVARPHMIIRVVHMMISALLPSLQILVTAQFVDTAIRIFNQQGTLQDIYLPLLGMMTIIGYIFISGALLNFVKIRIGMKLNEQLRVDIVKKRAKLEYQHIENNDTWELINRVCADPAGRINKGFDVILQLFDLMIRTISILFILLTQIWWVALVIILFSIPLFYIAVKSGKVEYDAYKEAAKYERKAGYLQGVITGRENVEERTLFSYTEDLNRKWYDRYEIARKIRLKVTARNFVKMKSASIITIFISLLITGVLISPLYSGSITIGMFMGLVTASFNLVQRMSWELSYLTKEIANNKEYLKDLTAFSQLSETIEALSLPDPITRTKEFRNIEFRNVSFKYPGSDHYILKNLSMKLTAHKQYALVGVNGAGKTTLIKILTGLYDQYEGEIYINDINLKEYNLSEIKGLYSIIYQDFARYYISLKDNVALGNVLGRDDAKIDEALAAIGLTDVIHRLPEGIDTYLGKINEKGIDLSGGEWQRVAIARMLMSHAPIYILDEPTASLDPIAESNVYEMFSKAAKGKSTILITHRLGAVKIADEIFVFDDGKIAQSGSHRELMQQDGLYAQMYESQRSWYD